MKAKYVFETMDFERGRDPKRAMGLGVVSVELDFHSFSVDEDTLKPDMSCHDTKSTIKYLNKIGVDWEVLGVSHGVDIKFTGTRSQIAKVLEMWNGADASDNEKAMMQWDGKNQSDLWDIIG